MLLIVVCADSILIAIVLFIDPILLIDVDGIFFVLFLFPGPSPIRPEMLYALPPAHDPLQRRSARRCRSTRHLKVRSRYVACPQWFPFGYGSKLYIYTVIMVLSCPVARQLTSPGHAAVENSSGVETQKYGTKNHHV